MVLRGDPWAPESISPTGATQLRLVVGQGAFACLGCSPDSEAAGAGQGTQSLFQGEGAVSSSKAFWHHLPPSLGFSLCPAQQPEGGWGSTFHYLANTATGEGRRMKGLGVFKFGLGVFRWFEKIIKRSCFCNPINFKPRIQIINSQQRSHSTSYLLSPF